MSKIPHSWILKIGLSCFWLLTGLFISHPFYINTSIYYLKDFISSLGGISLVQFCLTTTISSTHLLELATLMVCFLQIMLGFYVIIYPAYMLLTVLQVMIVVQCLLYAFVDPTLFYHPFGLLSKNICVLTALFVLRGAFLGKEEQKLRKVLVFGLIFLWIYDGLVVIFFQSPFLLNPRAPKQPMQYLGEFLIGFGIAKIVCGLLLYKLYYSSYRSLANLVITFQLLCLLGYAGFYLSQVLYYLYHPLGPFTKDCVVIAVMIYLLRDPLDAAL